MKNIFIFFHLLMFVTLSGMDFMKPHEEKRKVGILSLGQPGTPVIFSKPALNGWTTSIGQTKIFVTKGKIADTDGIADIIVGTQSDLKNSLYTFSSPHINNYPMRYGRYGYDYQKGK